MITDHSQREQALNPNQSFIVQAPAGSGKTELLVRRVLVLLANAEKMPEEILAITFTRKAASEMRHRIIQALKSAAQDPKPTDAYQLATWELAQKVLHKNEKQSWNLLQNPNRLRIQTIDSFCQRLTAQMPLLSQFGMQAQIIENAHMYYLEAARDVLNTLEENVTWSNALSHLLLHLDNQHEQIESLFIEMLARRDQWLAYVMLHETTTESLQKLRAVLEESLQHIVIENLKKCTRQFPSELQAELVALITDAASNLANNAISAAENPIIHCLNLTTLPSPILEHHAQWLGIAHFLLTQQQQWRRKVDKNLGFPQGSEMKAYMLQFMEKINSHEALRQALQDLKESPPCHYTSQQWEILEALLEVLPILAAQLKLTFAKHGQVDFSEVSLAALNALGDAESTTDIALYLDYKIRHILIDEFQDTSNIQFKLLEKLTANWCEDDGRTLFLVGDPMQSIYRFREAEVGLFLKAQQEGIGAIKLNPLCLQVNFRSTATIVNWINTNFQAIFPDYADMASGAIPYTSCVPVLENTKSHIEIQGFDDNEDAEANKIISIIQHSREQDATASIGILVRSRSHLLRLIPRLTQAKIAFSAVEIEALAHQSIIQDLLALTRALIHLADRTAWLSVLRAPWCGLNLQDLHTIASPNQQIPLWQLLIHYTEIPDLSPIAKQRLARLIPVLSYSLANRQRQNLREWIESTWIALGGPACLKNRDTMNYADVYFDLLETLCETEVSQPGYLEAKINTLYVSPKNKADHKLQIMTMHKAKGLEFDTVIIPSLERKSLSDRSQLLMWLNQPKIQGENDLILAPIKSAAAENDAIYQYLRSVEQKKKQFETARLLYVAVTRVKKHLYLLATVKNDKPPMGSFLALLWPQLKLQFMPAQSSDPVTAQIKEIEAIRKPLYRLTDSWQLPAAIQMPHFQPHKQKSNESQYEFKYIDNMPKITGTIIHQILQKIASEGLSQWNETKILSQYPFWKNLLLKNGVLSQEIAVHLKKIYQAISNTIQDQRGRWILDSNHLEARTEFAITTVVNNGIKHFIIDRTFIDRDTNIRWIIDYKTTVMEENSIAIEQYVSQLNQYAQAMRQIEQREIRKGLFFPLSSHWHEV